MTRMQELTLDAVLVILAILALDYAFGAGVISY